MHSSPSRFLGTAAVAAVALLCTSCSLRDRTARALEQAQRHAEAGDLEKAEIELKNALKRDPQNAVAFTRLGLLYHDQGRDARAAAFLLKARELQPENLVVRQRLGLARLAAGELKEARDEALFILDRQPADPQAPLLLVEASPGARELEEARLRLLALDPRAGKAPGTVVALGNIALRQNRPTEAEAAFQQALATDPNFVPALGAMALVHWSRKDLAAADAAFKQAAQLSPARSPKRLHYAQFKIQSGDPAAGRASLDELLRQTPDYLPAWVLLADLALTERRFDDADAALAKVFAREAILPDALLINARVRLARGENEKAVQELDRLATLLPRSASVSYHLALAHAANGDSAKAIARLTQVVSAAPEMTQAAIALAELQLRKRDYPAAIATLKPLVQQQPGLHAAQLLLAEAHRGRGEFEAAANLYGRLQQDLPRDPQVAYARALAFLQQNKNGEARAQFEQVRALQPDHAGAREQLVELDLREQRGAEARRQLEAEIARQPQSAPLTLLLARVCAALQDLPAAEAALKRAIELQPDSTLAHYQLAHLYVSQQQQARAIANLQETTRAHPQSLSPHLLLGVLLHETKDYRGARDAYEKALTLDPRSLLALNNLACLYVDQLEQLDRAQELAQRARTLNPNEPRATETLGWVLARRKQPAAALPLLQESAARLSDIADVHYHLGVVHYQLCDEDAARASLQRALELNRNFAGAADARARLERLALDARSTGAAELAALERQVAAEPDDALARLRLADAFRRSGDADKAQAHYKAVLQASPKNAPALAGLAALYAARKDLPKAIESAKAARAAAPDNRALAHPIGRIAFEAGDHRWAASLLQDCARQQPDNAAVLFDWAYAACSVGRVAEAGTAMRRVLELEPAFAQAEDARRFLDMLALAADPGAADVKPRIDRALQARPDLAPALMAAALWEERHASATQAVSRYEAVLARHPEFSPAQRNLLVLCAADPATAAKVTPLVAKARQAFPGDPAVTRAAGLVAFHGGDFARSVSLLQDVAKNSSDSETLYYLGMAQCRSNKTAEGRKTLQRALELGLKETLALEAKKRLAATP